MSSRLRSVVGASLFTLAVGAACTVKDHPDDPVGAAGTNMAGTNMAGGDGGRGGSAATAGTSSKAGRGGTTAKGGSGSGSGSGGDAGTGADAGAGGAPVCPGCDSGFCLDDGTCVDCLPSNDHCPAAQYCTAEYECVSGCKADGSSCASGICDEDHNCTSCIKDDECVEGLVCNSGTCGAACTEAQEGEVAACGTGLICCSLHCTDVAINANHCGACGSDCGAGEFCGIDACADDQGGAATPCVACHPTTLANICSIAEAVVILDTSKNPSDGNRMPGRAIGAALAAKCSPTPVLTEEEQDSVAALNFTTGRPVSGGRELLIVAGGPFFQNLEVYVEAQRIAPLYWHVTDGNVETQFRKSSDDEVVASLPVSGVDHDSHDVFLIQFMRDAASGSLVLNAQGFWLSGTVAAAFQLQEGMLPTLSTFDQAWYVYEWTDMDDDKAPDLDEMSLKASGR